MLKKLPQEMDFVRRMARRKEHYLAFLKYPRELRPLFSSTNLVEGFNRKIEETERACRKARNLASGQAKTKESCD